MKEITCTVKELFNAVAELNNIKYKTNIFYPVENIQIKNENNKYVKIKSLIVKEDKIIELKCENNIELKAAQSHLLCYDNKNKNKQLKKFKKGDLVSTINEDIKILNFKKTNKKNKVYDFEIDSKTHLYSTANKLVHHNSAGIGKSKTVIDELQASDVDYQIITGGIKNARALYMTLYDNNYKDTILVFDDVNNILKDKQSIEIMRVAVSNEKNRRITYTDSKITKEYKTYKPLLIFKSKIVIVTNIPKNKIDSAIISRTSPIEIIVSKEEIAEYILKNLADAPPKNVPFKWKEEVWEYLMEEIGIDNIKQFDFRVFEDAMLWRASTEDKHEWKKLIYALVA